MTTAGTPPDAATLLGMLFWRLSSLEEVWAMGIALEQVMRLGYAKQIACIQELITRGELKSRGKRGLVDQIADQLGISHREARERVKTAQRTMPRSDSLTGSGEPDLPAMAEALADGAVNATHMKMVGDLMEKLAAGVEQQTALQMEKVLADHARVTSPDNLKPVMEKVKNVMEQNTPPNEEKERAQTLPRQELTFQELSSGSSKISGIIGPESTMELKKAIAAFNKPRPATDEGPDPRSAAERDGDAFAEFVHISLNAGALPHKGGMRPHIAVSLRLEDLQQTCGKIILDGYGVTSPEVARRMACNSDVMPVVLGAKSQILDVGAEQRSAPVKLRKVLHLRDKGCAFPSCDRRVEYTEPHHIKPWAMGGKTVLENLVCLCYWHHKVVHHGEWECRMKKKTPVFIPPAWLDPLRQPRRNNRFAPLE